MASTVTKAPCLRSVWRKQHYATAAAAPAVKSSYNKPSFQPVKASVLPNKVVVAGAESVSPVSRVSIIFRAGSRFENYDNLGCTHTLRIAAGLGTEHFTHFGIRRTIQQAGGNLTCTTGRETITYTLEMTKDKIEDHLKILEEVACRQQFKPWEVSDNLPRLKLELASRSPQVWAVELLHHAAFRKGLGNSVYCPKHMVGKHNPELLKHYVNGHFTGERASVVGMGVDVPLLQNMASGLSLQSGGGSNSSEPSKFYSAEVRRYTSSPFAVVAVAGQAAGLKTGKDALAFAVLQRALGIGPLVKWGCGSQNNPLTQKVQAADPNASASALSLSYSDVGLFGFILAAPAESAGKAVEAGVQALKAADSIGDAELARGKAQLLSTLLMAFESGQSMVEELGLQAALFASRSGDSTLPMSAPSQVKAAIDGLSSADVKAVAKKIASGKLAMAAVGNLCEVPYLDQLK
ncbi:hypothetical protein J437_LFUL006874 [Ladona fulva]|uniref:Uncharacterized protein n=1 Tax=Ladona fulva TaxID=123851 RepID=A0A8K0KEV4_LADFU|nr:hypothetical protein J437_LFUL006874 [Ladona fulva]